MSLDERAFRHLPHLKQHIRDPDASFFRDLNVGVFDEDAERQGRGPNWRRSDENREATRAAALAGREDRELWVFAYGSLMWDPAFLFDEVRTATVDGYRRRFCMQSTMGRGTLERPGLMAGLDRGGRCEGLAFRIAPDAVETESEVLWRREMIMDTYVPTFIEVETGHGIVESLTFVVNPKTDRYMPDLDEDQTAQMIAGAEGRLGTNMDYLHNLARQLDILGLSDPDIVDLHQRASAIASEPEHSGPGT